MVRIALRGATRKVLIARLHAYATHTPRLVRRIHVLQSLAEGRSVDRPHPGRPPKLTAAKRQELKDLILAGPDAAGFSSACWTAGIIADLITRRLPVEYAPRYVCHFLGKLGFSIQKGRFTSDHLNDEAALLWLEDIWPAIVREANLEAHERLFWDQAPAYHRGDLTSGQ